MQGVVEAVFLLFHLDLRSGADIDDGHAAGQLGEALLKLLLLAVNLPRCRKIARAEYPLVVYPFAIKPVVCH